MIIETLGSQSPEKMEEEKKLPQTKIIKRKTTYETKEKIIPIKRVIEIINNDLKYGPITISTPYRNMSDKPVIHMSLQPEVIVPVQDRRNFYNVREIDFLFEYNKLWHLIEKILEVKKK